MHKIVAVAAYFLSSIRFSQLLCSISSYRRTCLPRAPAMCCLTHVFASVVAAVVFRGAVALLLRDYSRYLRASTDRYQRRLRRLRALDEPAHLCCAFCSRFVPTLTQT